MSDGEMIQKHVGQMTGAMLMREIELAQRRIEALTKRSREGVGVDIKELLDGLEQVEERIDELQEIMASQDGQIEEARDLILHYRKVLKDRQSPRKRGWEGDDE